VPRRRFRKARLDLLKAITSEKEECEVTLVQQSFLAFLDIDPNDTEEVDTLLEGLEGVRPRQFKERSGQPHGHPLPQRLASKQLDRRTRQPLTSRHESTRVELAHHI
jgi:hypothetical protein